MDNEPVTILLQRMATGDPSAGAELFQILYDDLRARARELMAGDFAHTLQPTAVVNEAWLKIDHAGGFDWATRTHFLGVAAKAMRSVLVDHARARKANKRGGAAQRVPLDSTLKLYEERAIDILALDEALDRLWKMDEELARLVELRFFSGLSIADTARAMGTSTATVERSWRTARSVLRLELGSTEGDEG